MVSFYGNSYTTMKFIMGMKTQVILNWSSNSLIKDIKNNLIN